MIARLMRRRTTRSQRGAVVIELVMAAAVSGILGTAVVGSLYQLHWTTADGSARFDVTTEVQRATRWLSRDIHRADSTDIVDGGAPVSTGTFDWTDASGAHSCAYALNGNALERTCDGQLAVVARRLEGLSFSRSGSLITLSFSVVPDGRSDLSEAVSMYLSLGRN